MKQFQKIGERVFDIEEFRKMLGISEDQYRNFNDLKRFVILVAQEELNSKTDISFSFEEIKIGRSVGKLRFFIKANKIIDPQEIEDADLLTESPPVAPTSPGIESIDRLKALLPEEFQSKESIAKILREYFGKHGYDYVARNIEYANSGSNAVNPGASLGKGSNYRSYLAKALRSDYGLAYREDQEASQAREAKAREAKEAATAAVRKDQTESLQDQENRERARVYRQSLAPEALASLREEALARLDPTQREHVARKAPGAEILLKLAMDKICLERMKLA